MFTNDPKGGDASSTKTETEPFRGQRHPRRRHGVALFPQAQITACGILDSHIYSYVNRFPAKCGIWILSHCFLSSQRPAKHKKKKNIVDTESCLYVSWKQCFN